VAVTDAVPFTGTLHVPVPVQAPDQPANWNPLFGVAVSVTVAPIVKVAVQVGAQLIPGGLLVTIPFPNPASETVSCNAGLKTALTVVFAVSATVQVVVPEQAPDQPANAKPLLGVAVSVTVVPPLNVALQVWPQLIPAGLLVIVPVPEPVWETVNWNVVGEGVPPLPIPPQPAKKMGANRTRHPKCTGDQGRTGRTLFSARLFDGAPTGTVGSGRVPACHRGTALAPVVMPGLGANIGDWPYQPFGRSEESHLG